MSELKSTIRIEDGFSEPLKDLAKAAWDADSAVTTFAKSLSLLTDKEYLHETATKSLSYALKSVTANYGPKHLSSTLTAANALKSSVIQSGSELVKRSGEFASQASKKLVSLKNEAAATVSSLKTKIPESGGKIKSGLKSLDITGGVKNLFAKIQGGIKSLDFTGSVKNMFGKIKDGLGSFDFTGGVKNMFGKIQDGLKNFDFKGGVKNLFGKIQDGLKSLDLKGLFGKIQNGLKSLDLKRFASKFGNSLKKTLSEMGNSLKKFGSEFGKTIKKNASEFGKSLEKNAKKGFEWLKKSEGFKIAKDFASEFGKSMMISITSGLIKKALNKMKDDVVKVTNAMSDAISNSLDELNLTDKMNAMYGEVGKASQEHVRNLANELGESATSVGEMAAKAAYQGIGTEDFERILRLGDRIGKLSLGETTESATSTLIDTVKSGHDASSVSKMLGGGEVMTRQLKSAGFERALNTGNLEKALTIAENIAKQAGLTDEKYEKASNSLSQNYKKIMNVVDNIKRRLAEIYVSALEPIVAKIAKFIQSSEFKFAIGVIELGFKAVGKVVAWLIDGLISPLINNIKKIGALIAGGIILKIFFMIKGLFLTISMIKFAASIVIGIIKFLGLQNVLLKIGAKLARLIGIGLLKPLAIAVAIGAAVYALLRWLHKASGSTKSFGDWIKGYLAAGLQIVINLVKNIITHFKNLPTLFKALGTAIVVVAKNVWHNITAFFGNLPDRFRIIGLKIKKGFIGAIGFVKSKIGEVLGWLISKVSDFIEESGLGSLLELIGVDAKGLSDSAKDWAASFGQDELNEVKQIEARIAGMESNQREYINVTDGVAKATAKYAGQLEKYTSMTEGVQEAIDTNGKSVTDKIGNAVDDIRKKVGLSASTEEKIQSDTSKIRSINEQEEELSWLKAFSDRQITSGYSSVTSNYRTVNINGMSQSSLAEMGRRSILTMPSRATL